MTRVAVAFLSGEAAALGLLTIHATRPIRTSHPSRSERRWYGIAKRSFDLTTATLLLILTAPIAIFVATTIRVRSGSPVLLRQTRLGRNGRPFEMWKFRTMVLDADPAVFWQHIRDLAEAAGSESVPQPDLRIPDDPRLTSTGRSLRRWSLDELPNLVNVVFGDMSLVGPRPLLPEEVDLIRRQFGDAAADGRSSVAPGVTGLAQVEGRDDISMAERSHLDLQYVAERSMSLDLWLILRTVAGVFRYRGA
ncbi:MAG: sugar transferase [Acidimicrobiia bacterium]|nr:sugar transferase [Acidimicrobiia bacterium]